MSGEATCDARIWPSWADRWTRCGSPVRADGRCVVYEHPDHLRRCSTERCTYGYARCPMAVVKP